jgi:hypothetical protein
VEVCLPDQVDAWGALPNGDVVFPGTASEDPANMSAVQSNTSTYAWTLLVSARAGATSGVIRIIVDQPAMCRAGIMLSLPVRIVAGPPTPPAGPTGGTGTTTITMPKVGGTAVDWCLNYGTACGKPAADAYCRLRGFAGAAQFQTAPMKATFVLGDRKKCQNATCYGLSSVQCIPNAANPPVPTAVLGTWYSGGNSSSQAPIQMVGGTLWLVNENGQRSRALVLGSTIVAQDWDGLRGTLADNGTRINWANNSSWQRTAIGGPQSYPNVGGTWYREGEASKPASIQQNGGALRVVNESGQPSRAHFQGGAIIADDWGGLVGTLVNNGTRINWANNSSWQRTAIGGPQSYPNVGGTWYREGEASKPASIQQNGGTLRVVNEFGQASRAHFQNGTIVADDWNGLVGTLVNGGRRINWANNSSWQR